MRGRLIIDGLRPPSFNMAADLHLLREASRDRAVLRLYQWYPSAVSLGRSQPLGDVNLDAARLLGVWIVRRPTGGRGIYHAPGDLTFALVIHAGSLPEESRSPMGVAVLLATALADALRDLGIPAEPRGHVTYRPRGPICVLAQGSGDIILRGRKIGAIAALARRDSILAHGVLIRRMDYTVWASLFRVTPLEAEELRRTVAGIEDLDYKISLSSLAPRVARALSKLLGARFTLETWSPSELEIIQVNRGWEWRP